MLLIFVIVLKVYSQGWLSQQINNYVSTIYGSCQNYQLSDQNMIICFGGQVANTSVDTLMTLHINDLLYRELIELKKPTPRLDNIIFSYSRHGHQSIGYKINTDNYFLIHGGQQQDNSIYLNDIWVYEVSNNIFINDNIPNSPTLSFHAVDINPKTNIMYIFGGQSDNQTYSRKLYSYDCVNKIMQELKYYSYQNLTQIITLWDATLSTKTYSTSQEIQTFLTDYVFSDRKTQFNISLLDYQIEDCDNDYINMIPCLSHHRLIYNEDCNCLLVFGGRRKNLQYNQDIWIFDLNQSIWFIFQTKMSISSNTQTPPPRIDFDVKFTKIFKDSYILFGGLDQNNQPLNDYWYFNYKIRLWNQIQNDSMDQTNWPIGIYGHSMQLIENVIYIIGEGLNNSLIYTNNQSLNGHYHYGIQFCNQGWKGVQCNLKSCPGICFYFIADQSFCIECSENGQCIDGVCQCNNGFTGEDCSQQSLCENNCSNATNSYGECNLFYPQPQCKCDMENKIGGDDCSVTFCLNDCSSNGNCVSGSCQCQNGYIGSDCSILGVIFLENIARLFKLSLIIIIYLVI